MWVEFNNNPMNRTNVGDCAVRAISKALDVDWERAYLLLCVNGMAMANIMNANEVIGSVLRQNGFYRDVIDNECPDCYSVADFAEDNPKGTYVLGTGTHVVAVIDGNIYDAWDSSNEIPLYVFYKQEEEKK